MGDEPGTNAAVRIRLIGGPMDGVYHELHGVYVPAKMGLCVDESDPVTHWYAVADDEKTASYIGTKP